MVNNTSLKPFPAVQMFKTHYIKGTLNPEWNYPSPLDWGSILSQKCYLYLIVYLFLLQCFDHDNDKDDLLCVGEQELDYSVFKEPRQVNVTMKNPKKTNKTGGSVLLDIVINETPVLLLYFVVRFTSRCYNQRYRKRIN